MICKESRLFAGGGVLLFGLLVLPLDQAAVVPTVVSWSSSGLRQAEAVTSKGERSGFRYLATTESAGSAILDRENEDVGGCILIFFGTLDRGDLGSVAQPVAMERLLASVAPPDQCFSYAHPWVEDAGGGGRTAEFSNGDLSRFVPVPDGFLGEVNRFKALVIGGGGLSNAKKFAVGHFTLPIIAMGVRTSKKKNQAATTLLGKASFVSGRDASSVDAISGMLRKSKRPATTPGDVALVRDPVLSDQTWTDTEGTCWKQSEGESEQPLCFVLPASNLSPTAEMHRQLVNQVVRTGDVFVNVSPKHQSGIEERGYPGQVLQVVDPTEFSGFLCSCRAIISTNFHATALGLHMGVPTFGAFRESSRSEVRELMVDAMRLPEQYLIIDEHLTRDDVDLRVRTVRQEYASRGRRAFIHGKLSKFHRHFENQARHVLFDIIGLQQQRGRQDAPSLASALLANGDVFKRPSLSSPQFGDRNAFERPDAISGGEPVHHQVPGGGSTPADDVIEDASSSHLIHNPYVVATLLVVAVTASALWPSGRAAKRPPPVEPEVGKAVDAVNVQNNGDSCTSSDSEVGEPERPSSGRLARSTRATGVAATSSKVIFMLNFTMWVFLAVGFVGHGRAYLGDTHDPVGLLVLQGATGVMVLGLLGRFGVLDLHRGKDLTPAAAQQAGLAAFLHTGQALLTNFALLLGGITITNALKGLEPVAAAAFSYVLLGKPCSGPRMAALATLLGGIVLMMFEGGGSDTDGEERADGGTESGYLLTSIFMVLAAVCCNALRNVVIKMGNPTPPHQTLLSCSAAATMVGLVLVLLRFMVRSTDDLLERGASDLATVDGGDTGTAGRHDLTTSWLRMDGVNAALCFVGYNLASFNLLARLSPVGHAVGDSCKRMVVFASGPLFLGEVMSVRQLGGMAVALFGVLAYNVVEGY